VYLTLFWLHADIERWMTHPVVLVDDYKCVLRRTQHARLTLTLSFRTVY